MRRYYSPKYITLYVAIAVVLVAAVFFGFRFFTLRSTHNLGESFTALQSCFRNNTSLVDSLDATCSSHIVAGLLQHFTTKDLMDYIVASTTPNEIRSQCHEIAHVIGEQTFKKYNSLDIALSECTDECSLGCIHGAIGAGVANEFGTGDPAEIEHADISTIEAVGEKYCNDSNAAICHAIGHLLFAGLNNFDSSLDICKKISTGWHRDRCYKGVFMEGVGGDSKPLFSHAEAAIPDNDYLYPCDRIGDEYKSACFFHLGQYQDILFTKQGITDFLEKLKLSAAVCEGLGPTSRENCFVGIGYKDQYLYTSTSTTLYTFCDQLGELPDREACTLGIVKALVNYNTYVKSLNYCGSINEQDRQNFCYNVAFQSMEGEVSSSDITDTLCTESNAASLCSLNFQKYLNIRSELPWYYLGYPTHS